MHSALIFSLVKISRVRDELLEDASACTDTSLYSKSDFSEHGVELKFIDSFQ